MGNNITTRRTFLRNVSAATVLGAVAPTAAMALNSDHPSAAFTGSTRKGPKRGVSLYSYSAEFGLTKTLEDCFEDIYDMGATGVEILANAHIENYPYPTDEWLAYWWSLCMKYDIEPAEYGHWIDGRVLQDRELTVEETAEYLIRDMHLAHRMGFKCMRTKVTVKDGQLAPIDNWSQVIDSVLPLAERLDLRLLPEIHSPSTLSSGFIMHYLDYIKRTGTKHFGLNIDFSVFNQNVRAGSVATQPEEIIPLLPYVYCCHAKFVNMDDNFHETQIPYEKLLNILVENGYNGYLLSEYEGADKYDEGYEVGQTLRKHHIMMKNILGY